MEKLTRVIHEEKKMSWNRLTTECLRYPKIESIEMGLFHKTYGNYFPMIVQEFYATYTVILNGKRGMQQAKASMKPLEFKKNNFYSRREGDDDFSLKHTDYDEMMNNPDDHRVWVTSVIAKETPNWIDPAIDIHKKTLKKKDAKFWLGIISLRVLPSFNDINIGLEKAIVIAALLTESKINVGEIIQDEIRDRVQQKNISFPYPCLITALCQKTGVSQIDKIDRYTEPK
ncbi:hypothetical protein RND71_035527 [Anisodus tanguticus]|uniref:Putative plant transposon protein domain-containing protein n=1 Tax=Anisodus tanguticus TaxID=243964 RepID=A0AAE1R5Q0_9SOLA|nr:hypothetical protein RND71_035527 [Anisodus tanguticus]